eukprot:3128587-Amphidinium_carterae.1
MQSVQKLLNIMGNFGHFDHRLTDGWTQGDNRKIPLASARMKKASLVEQACSKRKSNRAPSFNGARTHLFI